MVFSIKSTLIVGSVLFLCSCAKSDSIRDDNGGLESRAIVAFVPDPECYTTIQALDYSDLMSDLITESRVLRMQLGKTATVLDQEILDIRHPGMTDSEQEMIMGIHYLSRFATFSDLTGKVNPKTVVDDPQFLRVIDPLRSPQSMATDFSRFTGRKPHDGAELLLYIRGKDIPELDRPGLNNIEGLETFLSWSREKQLDYIMVYVNPITGKVYEDFTDSSWRPGEIHLTSSTVDDVRELADIQYDRLVKAGEAIPSGLKFTVFGERENSILTQFVRMNIQPGSAALGGIEMQDPNGIAGPNPPLFTQEDATLPVDLNPCNPCGAAPENNSNPCNPCGNPCGL